MKTISMPQNCTRIWVEKNYPQANTTNLTLDFCTTEVIDSAGIAMVHLLQKDASTKGFKLILLNIPNHILNTLNRWKISDTPQSKQSKETFFVHIGDCLHNCYITMLDALSILAEMLYWGTFGLLKRRDYRHGVLGEQMYQLGFNAIGITIALSFLIGIVLSIQSAIQLKQFGADIFLVAMVVMGMVREIGPIMTAIVLAGRSGSATTAEVATMCVQEEVDALQTMGLNQIQFIVVPKMWAITITMPILSMLSIIFGIFGGFLVGFFYLGLTPALFWSELVKNIILKDFIISFFKSIVFAWLIVWIGAFYGFKVKGGAEEVGKETTASVVTAIFVIIIADAVFSFIYNIQL